MTDLTTISALLSSVKTATDIAKFIKDSDVSLENAETKLKIAELIITLADVKLELAGVQDTLREKDIKIQSLLDQIQQRENLKYDGKLYWNESDETPFCPSCYENNNKLIHLTYYQGTKDTHQYYICKICENNYV